MPPASNPARTASLAVDEIVAAARHIIETDGLRALTMRRLGEHLGVDPMAVYYHVPNKHTLLALVTTAVIADVNPHDRGGSWDERIRRWVMGYWDVVAAHADLIAAGLTDQRVAGDTAAHTEPLVAAIRASGLPEPLIEPTAWALVDLVHGSALSTRGRRVSGDTTAATRAQLLNGLDVVIAGIASIAAGACE